jgi:ribosomal protein S18 acetylase RimI-like enzyme
MNIVALDAAAVGPLLGGFVAVYGAAFCGPPYNRTEREVAEFGRALPLHLKRAGFRGAVAYAEGGAVAGFAYGYLSLPGQWWYDNVSVALGREATRVWLADAFQLTEIAVRPEWQGRGLGKGLHDELLRAVTAARAVLSTLDTPTVASEMYRRRGWEQLLSGFRFPGVARAYSILGKVMPDADRVGQMERYE